MVTHSLRLHLAEDNATFNYAVSENKSIKIPKDKMDFINAINFVKCLRNFY